MASASACATVASSICWRSRFRRSSSAAMRAASLGSSSSSSRTPRSARPMRPPALMRGPSRKPRCQGSGGPDKPRCIHQRGQPDLLAPAQRDQALGDEGAVEALERHHVGDGAERDQMQAATAGRARGRMPVQKLRRRNSRVSATSVRNTSPTAARWPRPERSSARFGLTMASCRRQFLVGLMMVEDHNVEPELAGFYERYMAGGPAIDGDQKLDAALGKRADGVHIRPVAFENPVRNVDDRIEPAVPQIMRQQRRGGGAVDIVIAENRYTFAVDNGMREARAGRFHIGQRMRIGHQPLDGGIEIGRHFVRLDAAAGEHARQQFRHAVALRDGRARAPGPARPNGRARPARSRIVPRRGSSARLASTLLRAKPPSPYGSAGNRMSEEL